MIRTVVDGGRLEDAEAMLNSERERLTALGDPARLELAQLTALAGDHAAAAGRPGHAKWLWRLALKRFGELGAMSSPPAQAVAERMRTIDQ